MKSLYLWVDLGAVLVPFIFSFHPKIKFYKTWPAFIPAAIVTAILFLIWDSIFVNKRVWGFNERYTLGPHFYNIPLEEILFFICIPYACVFTYYCLNLFFTIKWKNTTENIIAIVMSIILIGVGLIFIDRLYTSVTFISTGIVIIMLKNVFKVDWFGKLASIYVALLLPFFIVNGILTGTGLEEPVVWYNNGENLGIRLGTIPMEDMVYGFELMLINILIFEYLLKKLSIKRI